MISRGIKGKEYMTGYNLTMSTQVMALKLVELSEGRDCTSIYAYNGTFNKGVLKIYIEFTCGGLGS